MREEQPPTTGELEFTVPGPPVSQQSTRSEKDRFTDLIRNHLPDRGHLLSGDVQVEIEWSLHEQDRYESDAAPDVDNILKPLLDAFCGPEGFLIDDCQVQAISCHWIDWPASEQQIHVRVRFVADEWISKGGLCFVRFAKGLCFPINRTDSPGPVLLMVEHINNMIAKRNERIRRGWDYYQANYFMSVQRVFHRSRLGRFKVLDLEAFRSELEAEMACEPPTAELIELEKSIAELRAAVERSND